MTSSNNKQPLTGWQRTVAIRLQKLTYTLSRRWLAAFNIFLAFYVGLPILAPTLMYVGATAPARLIYAVYGPMCHQMASRSYFLFGEQIAYPRQLAGSSLGPFESYMTNIPEFAGVSADPYQWAGFLIPARRFLGNAQMGYKLAVCERDIAIYSFVLVGGLVYGLLRRRLHIRPLPFLAFMILGMGPIGLDGFSQLFGQFATAPGLSILQNIFVLRESTPFLRTFTGALFGFTLAWLTFPHINAGMADTEAQLTTKLQRIGELKK